MKTFNKTHLPESIRYNGQTYTHNSAISAGMMHSGTSPQKVIEAARSTGKKAVLVKVLSNNLKGKTDLHGNQYKPTSHIFTT